MDNFAEILWRFANEAPDRTAVTLLYSRQPDEPITYAQLARRAAAYARELERVGVRPGEVTPLILQHGPDLLYAFWGAVLLGAVPAIMPFLTEKLAPEPYRQALAALFQITRPTAVVTYPEFVAEIQAAQSGQEHQATVLSTVAVPPLDDAAWAAFDWPGRRRLPEETVLLQHSSGTTGLQKGVALSHRAVFNQLESYARAIRLSAEDVIVSWLPLYHDMGLIAGFLMPILRGVPLVLMSPFDWVRAPGRLMQAVSRFRGTLTWLPNFAYNFCAQKVRERDLEGVDLSSWRAVINCSEPMHWKSHQLFLERFRPYGLRPGALATCYAMAENVFAVTQGGIDRPVVEDLVSAPALLERQVAEPATESTHTARLLSTGRPIDNTRVRVLDAEGRDLPERHIGEIALQSDCMLTGYFNRPDLTEKAFLDGWYLTGDLGYLADGELYVTGRKKDLIIVGGKNVYPQDLERIANEVEGVHPGRVVAFGVFNEQAGTEDAVLVAESDLQGDEALALADTIRRRVTQSSDVALRYVQVVPRNWLLKTSSGKIARLANRDKYLKELQVAG